MSNRGEMQTIAYCWESDSITPAEMAVDHSRDTYYCPEEICLIQVTPARKINAYYSALPNRLHDIRCRYYKKPIEGDGIGDPRPEPSPPPVLLIPTFLGQRRRIPRLRKPDLVQLLNLVRAAKIRPPVVAGTLEQVVTAWTKMTPAERSCAPLTIGENATSYRDAFFFLRTAVGAFEKLPWSDKIIYGAADLYCGRNGSLYLYSLKRFQCGEKNLQLSVKLNDASAATSDKEYMIRESGCSDKVTMFWFGPVPEPEPRKRWLSLILPKEMRYAGLALRQGVHE